MAELVVLRRWLTEAEEAHHQLATGKQVSVVVDQNGERVEYQRASRQQLAAYINELRRQIAVAEGVPTGTDPIRVWGI